MDFPRTRGRKKRRMRCLYLGLSLPLVLATQADRPNYRFCSKCVARNVNNHVLTRTTWMRGGSRLEFSNISTLPAGIVKDRRGSFWLWKIPLLVAFASFSSFRPMSYALYRLVEWTSHQNWLPSTDEQINLQTNVVTQVVNGPVITSISVLFASLVSTTIANLHERQVTIQKSLIREVHHHRLLKALLESSFAQACLSTSQREKASLLIQQHSDVLFSGKYSTPAERTDAHLYIESSVWQLLQWCHAIRCHPFTDDERSTPPSRHRKVLPTVLLSEVESLSNRIMQERANRWMALQAVQFPNAHYLTLALLAIAIATSFLVATAQAQVLFRDPGLFSVRILWSVLMTAFAALGVVCFDLSSPFGGAYTVASSP